MATKHFILIKREAMAKDGHVLSARESSRLLLQFGLWPLWSTTRNRLAVKPGDSVAIYLAGYRQGMVVAQARVDAILPWTRSLEQKYPLVLDGIPVSALKLVDVRQIQPAIDIRSRLPSLSFYTGTPKWGVAFMGGMRAISSADFSALTKK